MDDSQRVSRKSLDRERLARRSAEQLLEEKSRELWEANSRLKAINDELERRVQERTAKLEKATKAASQASVAKSHFLANMSHELRTPMTSILGFAELLSNDDLSHEEQESYLKTIQRNGGYLLALINDILDLTKIEDGKMSVECIDTSLAELVESVRAMLVESAQLKGIGLRVICDLDVPEHIESDPVRVRQVIINLVGNAIKFTQEGEVCIRVSHDARAGRCEIAVEDTGIGIRADQLDRVFKSFAQADSSTTREFGGTGLGLYISRQLAELLGGSLTARSTPGQGSVFVCSIATGDLRTGSQSGNKGGSGGADRLRIESGKPGLDGALILLVEDGKDNQRLISHILKRAGAKVEIRENGQLAVDHLIGEGALERYDLVLMDMQMPVLDGYGATRELRRCGAKLPIVAITANAMSHDKQLCLDAGCDDYITKPINRTQLIEKCADWIQSQDRCAHAKVA